MLIAHCVEPRHASVSEQQLAMMHWLHGVPPGSSEHGPESMVGVPQCCPEQTRPTQHCEVSWHVEPGGRHVPVPQTPASQIMEQHSSGPPQLKPSSLHCPAPQTPSSHMPLQHSNGLKQPKPSGVHMVKPHVPSVGSQKPLQHSTSLPHGNVSGRQLPQVENMSLQ